MLAITIVEKKTGETRVLEVEEEVESLLSAYEEVEGWSDLTRDEDLLNTVKGWLFTLLERAGGITPGCNCDACNSLRGGLINLLRRKA